MGWTNDQRIASRDVWPSGLPLRGQNITWRGLVTHPLGERRLDTWGHVKTFRRQVASLVRMDQKHMGDGGVELLAAAANEDLLI